MGEKFAIVARTRLDYNRILKMEFVSKPGCRVVFEFGSFRADPLTRRLLCETGSLPITPKAFETLLVLIANRGQVVSKQQLMEAVWANTAVEENNLTQQIAALRRIFSERAGEHRFIVTIPGKGYSFVSSVTELHIAPNEELLIMESTLSSVTIDLSHSNFRAGREFLSRSSVFGYTVAAAYILIVSFLAVSSTFFPAEPHSVAVLSFRTSVGDQELGAGIRDTLRARLGNLEDVALKPSRIDLPVDDAVIAGRQLNADVVFTGSVQRENDRVRVAVEIVDVREERIIWGRTFDYDRSSVFELQDAIAGEAMQAIKTSTL